MVKSFTPLQIKKLADISADFAQVCLGGIVVPFIFQNQDLRIAAAGLALACAGWFLSLYFVQKASYER